MSKNQTRNVIIDGLEITIHSIGNVIEGPKDIYTCMLPLELVERAENGAMFSGKPYVGAAINTTEITEGIDKHYLQSRVESPYFRNTLFDWICSLNDPGERTRLLPLSSDMDVVITQLKTAVRPKDETNMDLGRLYGQKQHMFAKLELNSSWSLIMHNERPASSGLEFDYSVMENNGPWGIWTATTNAETRTKRTGAFQLVHRKSFSPHNRELETVQFRHSGKVASASVTGINAWFREEFFSRWEHVLSPSFMETLEFVFDPSCIEERGACAADEMVRHDLLAGYDSVIVPVKNLPIRLVALGGILMLKPNQKIWLDNEEYTALRWTKTRDNAPGAGDAWAITVEDSAGGEFDIVVGDGDLSVYANCKTYTFGQIGVEHIPRKINKQFGEG